MKSLWINVIVGIIEAWACDNCRFNPDGDNDHSGGDCINCDEKIFSEWMELKRYNPEECTKCYYENDPCYYLCVECQDSKNFRPKSDKELLEIEINKRERELRELKIKWKGI